MRLNRDRQARHVFTIQVMDDQQPPRSALAMVTVTLTDINDNPPAFSHHIHSWSISEGMYSQPQVLGNVEAYDADVGLNQRLTYSLSNGNQGE